jgi:hypothetical protein
VHCAVDVGAWQPFHGLDLRPRRPAAGKGPGAGPPVPAATGVHWLGLTLLFPRAGGECGDEDAIQPCCHAGAGLNLAERRAGPGECLLCRVFRSSPARCHAPRCTIHPVQVRQYVAIKARRTLSVSLRDHPCLVCLCHRGPGKACRHASLRSVTARGRAGLPGRGQTLSTSSLPLAAGPGSSVCQLAAGFPGSGECLGLDHLWIQRPGRKVLTPPGLAPAPQLFDTDKLHLSSPRRVTVCGSLTTCPCQGGSGVHALSSRVPVRSAGLPADAC